MICILSFSTLSCAEAFPNEPNGFRDLRWGESLQDIQSKGYDPVYVGYFARQNAVVYGAFLADPYISNQKSSFISLYFWNNKLYSIVVNFGEPYKYDASADAMFSSLCSLHGFKFITYGNDGWSWYGDTANVSLVKNKDGTFCVILTSEYYESKATEDAASKGW